MLTGIVSSRGFLKRLDDVGSLPVWSIDGSHLPDDMLALLDHLLDLAGTHGDPQARRPLQSDLLRRHREGPIRFVPWAVHSERPTRRLCEAKRHLKEGPAPRYESSIRTKSFIEPRTCRLIVFPMTASSIASSSAATDGSATPSARSICPAASRRRGTSRLPSRAGIKTGRSVRSLTQRTSCGRVKSRCAYQSPNFVEGGADAVSSVVPSRFRSLAVHRRVNMRLFGLTVSQALGLVSTVRVG